MLQQALQHWRGALGAQDLWIFGYASLLWRPEFSFSEQRPARVRGYHRALKMWSHVNRGTPERPGLVFALLPIYWMVNMSFKTNEEILSSFSFFPQHFTWANYRTIFTDASWYSGYLNSLIYVAINTVISVCVALPATCMSAVIFCTVKESPSVSRRR